MCLLASHPQRPPSTSGTGAKGVGLGVALGASGLSGTWRMGPLRQAHPGEAPTISNPRNHGSVRSRAKPLYITTEMERGTHNKSFVMPNILEGQFQHHSWPVSYTVLCRNTHQFGWFDKPTTSQLFTGTRVGMIIKPPNATMATHLGPWGPLAPVLLVPTTSPHRARHGQVCGHRKVVWWRGYYTTYICTTIGKVW